MEPVKTPAGQVGCGYVALIAQLGDCRLYAGLGFLGDPTAFVQHAISCGIAHPSLGSDIVKGWFAHGGIRRLRRCDNDRRISFNDRRPSFPASVAFYRPLFRNPGQILPVCRNPILTLVAHHMSQVLPGQCHDRPAPICAEESGETCMLLRDGIRRHTKCEGVACRPYFQGFRLRRFI